jgi:AcrR family transcriptional regulator
VSRRVDLPDQSLVRQAMAEVIAQARDEGKRPTVLALARRLGISNPTLWRHFPDIARELVDMARVAEPQAAEPAGPSRYQRLREDHASLKRKNAQLRHDLELAKASIQRLALDNQQLRQQLEGAAKVISIDPARRTRYHPDA